MSFVEQEDVFEVVESLMTNLFKTFSSKDVQKISKNFMRRGYVKVRYG